MTNLQLYLSIGIPTVTVILAWLSNRADNHRLEGRIESVEAKVEKFAESLRAEMITFRREIHQDLLLLHERVVKVETRQDLQP